MNKLLVLFTSCYPNTNGEVFVENEIRILERYFEKILIICSTDKKVGIDRYIPKNAEVYVFKDDLSFFQKVLGIPFLFKRIF